MTRPLAITANTPIASNTFVHTPVNTKIINRRLRFIIGYSGHQQLHLHTFSHFKSLSCKRKKKCLQLWYHADRNLPMSLVFLGTIRRSSRTIFMASRRISKILLMRASRGARGNAATNMVVKLNCITGIVREKHGHLICYSHFKMPISYRDLELGEDSVCYFTCM